MQEQTLPPPEPGESEEQYLFRVAPHLLQVYYSWKEPFVQLNRAAEDLEHAIHHMFAELERIHEAKEQEWAALEARWAKRDDEAREYLEMRRQRHQDWQARPWWQKLWHTLLDKQEGEL